MNKEELYTIIEKEGDYKEIFIKGIKCTIKRHPSLGTLCGYVYLTKHFNEWGKYYDELDIIVHGGLTYSQQEDEYWVIGFDCAHSEDLVPNLDDKTINNDTYRDMEYVENEIREIINQLDCKLWDRLNKLDKIC